MSAYLGYIFKFILWSIAIMSGSLAIFREALSIFAPNKAPSRSVFWNCVIIAFIISVSILWYLEHQKAMSNKPKLNAEFGIFSSAPGGEKNENSIVTINAIITNTGAPSIAQHIKVEIEAGGEHFDGLFIPWPKEGLINLKGKDRAFIIRAEDDLQRKCLSQPIATGGAAGGICFLLFSGLKENDIYKIGTTIILTFADVLGKKYCFKKEVGEKGIPPPDITKLQKKE